jgi:hypothetical protein
MGLQQQVLKQKLSKSKHVTPHTFHCGESWETIEGAVAAEKASYLRSRLLSLLATPLPIF